MQPVTKGYQRGWKIARKRAPSKTARSLKREAHRRQRAATREWLSRQDWDGAVLEAKPITDWDVC